MGVGVYVAITIVVVTTLISLAALVVGPKKFFQIVGEGFRQGHSDAMRNARRNREGRQ